MRRYSPWRRRWNTPAAVTRRRLKQTALVWWVILLAAFGWLAAPPTLGGVWDRLIVGLALLGLLVAIAR